MKWLLGLVLLLAAAVAVISALVRLAPTDPAQWHVDPDVAELPATEKYAVLRAETAVRYSDDVARVAAAWDAAAMGLGSATRIAGDLEDGWATYQHRTPLMGYPDFVSIKVVEDGDDVVVSAFARARYGRRDFGVNAERLERIRAVADKTLSRDAPGPSS